MKVVAVTFPAGRIFKNESQETLDVRIDDETLRMMASKDVPLVRAHLPFDLMEPGPALSAKVGGSFNLLAEALNMFCGSMSLCVQAIALACDAGCVESLEHVVALTSDTAILAQSANTQQMLSRLIIREVICKPAVLTIGRKEERLLSASSEPEKRELEKPAAKSKRRQLI